MTVRFNQQVSSWLCSLLSKSLFAFCVLQPTVQHFALLHCSDHLKWFGCGEPNSIKKARPINEPGLSRHLFSEGSLRISYWFLQFGWPRLSADLLPSQFCRSGRSHSVPPV